MRQQIRSEVEQFQKNMPIVKTLGNPCLKDRHWEKISEIVGFPMRVTDDLTLAKILDYGLEEYVAKFEAISDSATKENDLETRLNAMMAEWKDMRFELSARRSVLISTLLLTARIEYTRRVMYLYVRVCTDYINDSSNTSKLVRYPRMPVCCFSG